ncbi:MAG: 16S rRNA (guanine(527)-N(7))-methyltransferase RsmG [Bacteroidales bacterium]|nr:16S rRNA (guanine(527)-N(7))-methyltransferase RsmG [Bacteroidales bacterium]
MDYILKYFPSLSEKQLKQFESLYNLYLEWNSKINVISRKDIENLYLHHVLHSLGIAKFIGFKPTTQVLDFGTGGGFPGIPLAIYFPEVHFHLIDSIRKKVKVAQEVAQAIGLENVTFAHIRGEEIEEKYDFIVSRAVMSLPDLIQIIQKNIKKEQKNSIPNGLLCLKGGDLTTEIKPFKSRTTIHPLNTDFEEEFFDTKKVVFVPL